MGTFDEGSSTQGRLTSTIFLMSVKPPKLTDEEMIQQGLKAMKQTLGNNSGEN